VPIRQQRLQSRFLIGFCALALPVLAAVLLAWALAAIDLTGVLLISASVVVTACLVMRLHIRDLRSLLGYLEDFRLSDDEKLPPAPKRGSNLLTAELASKMVDTARERQRERRELKTLIAGNEAILAALPYPLLTLTPSRRIARANPAATELFDENLTGRDLISILRVPDLVKAAEAVLDGAEDSTVEFTIEGRLTQYFVANVTRLPAPLLDQAIAIVALMDVTALKRAEQLRADFVANASHELRTPLSSLLGFIETLQGPARDDAEARDNFLVIMQEQGERMVRLVEDLLSLSRVELHEHTPPTAATDIAKVLTAVVEGLEPQARQRQLRIALELPETLPKVQGDADELTQVFQNLVDNATKYSRPNTVVTVSARSDGASGEAAAQQGGSLRRPSVSVSISDQGEGIPREHLPRLTERFYRVDTARSRAMGGTGLGLAIVKHIVNRHRGRLEIESRVNRGSIFTVHLRAISQPSLVADNSKPKRPYLRAVGD